MAQPFDPAPARAEPPAPPPAEVSALDRVAEGDPDFGDRMRRGDPAVFERLATAGDAALRAMALRAFADQRAAAVELARDAVQDTWERAFTGCAAFGRRGHAPGAWLYGILRRVIAERRRSEGRRAKYLRFEATLPRGDDGELLVDAPAPEPGDLAVDPDELAAELTLLPDEERTVVVVYFLVGLTLREVAAALDLTIDQVRGRLDRALGTLRERLEFTGSRYSSPRRPTGFPWCWPRRGDPTPAQRAQQAWAERRAAVAYYLLPVSGILLFVALLGLYILVRHAMAPLHP